VGIISCIKISW